MTQCLRITFCIINADNFLSDELLSLARKNGVEGIAQWATDTQIKIIICGTRENVDSFVDEFHAKLSALQVTDLEFEPFIKDKDYRGVFRIIE